jgi:tetratricopeptide (TPR) repeat protein
MRQIDDKDPRSGRAMNTLMRLFLAVGITAGVGYYAYDWFHNAQNHTSGEKPVAPQHPNGAWKKVTDENSVEYANMLKNKARVSHANKKYKESDEQFKQALTIYQKTVGDNHVDYAYTLGLYGDHRYAIRDFQAAEVAYKTALGIYQANDPKSAECVRLWRRLANVYHDTKRDDQSRIAYTEASKVESGGADYVDFTKVPTATRKKKK